MIPAAQGLGRLHRLGEEFEGGDGGESAGEVELAGPVGIGAGPLGQHQVIQLDIFLNGPGGANPDNVLHAEHVKQLVGVNADGRHAHAGGHDGHLHPFVQAGVPLDAPDVIHQHGIFQEGFRNKLGPQGSPNTRSSVPKSPGLALM